MSSTAHFSTIPGGLSAEATQYAQLVHAGGQFNNPGDAQASTFILRNVTNSTTPQLLYLDCNEQTNPDFGNGTPCENGMPITFLDDRAMAYTLRGVARIMASSYTTLTVSTSMAFFSSGLVVDPLGTGIHFPGESTKLGVIFIRNTLDPVINVADGRLRVEVKQYLPNLTVRWMAVIETAELGE